MLPSSPATRPLLRGVGYGRGMDLLRTGLALPWEHGPGEEAFPPPLGLPYMYTHGRQLPIPLWIKISLRILNEGTAKIAGASFFGLARPCRRICCSASNPAPPVQNLDSPSSPPEPLVPGVLRRPKTGYSSSGSNRQCYAESSDVQTQRGLSDMSVAAPHHRRRNFA